MSDSLKHKTAKATAWSALDSIANQGIAFIISLILARILTPQEYGLIGIIIIFIQIFKVFINSGFSTALIRKLDCNQKDYSTVFLFNIVISIFLFIILWLCAPIIAEFFNRRELISLSRGMGIILIINALGLIQTTILTKEIDFKKQTKISLIASISSGIIGVIMAFMDYGVWALVGQQVSRQGINTLLLWIWSNWRPILIFSFNSFKTLWSFGWKLLLSSLIDTTWNEIYQVVIGKFYTPASLGQYTRAQQFSSLFSSNLTNVVRRVSFPVLSSLQEDKIRLRVAYQKVIRSTMLVTFICMICLAVIAKPLIIVLIGEKWLPCVPMLQILCFNMMFYPLHALNLTLLQVEGRSDLFLKLEILKKIIAIGPILIGIFIGILWMLAASVISSLIAYYLNAYYSGKLLNYNIIMQIKDILPSFFIALTTALSMYILSFLPFNNYILLTIQLLVGSFILFIILELVKPTEYLEIKSLLFKFIKK